MGWNGMELQGGAGGSVTDRPTDRLFAILRRRWEKEQSEKGERETQKGSLGTLFQKWWWYSSRYLRSRNSILKRISFAPGR